MQGPKKFGRYRLALLSVVVVSFILFLADYHRYSVEKQAVTCPDTNPGSGYLFFSSLAALLFGLNLLWKELASRRGAVKYPVMVFVTILGLIAMLAVNGITYLCIPW